MASPLESILGATRPLGLRRSSAASDDEMDITPMIDMTFLLLIYFVVCSTPDSMSAVELPRALKGDAVEGLYSTVVTVADGGLDAAPVYLADGKEPSALVQGDAEQQESKLHEAVLAGSRDGKRFVLIKADKGVPFREMWRVTKAVSGVEEVQVAYAVLEQE